MALLDSVSSPPDVFGYGRRIESRALDLASVEKAIPADEPGFDGGWSPSRWRGTALFWLGVAALIAARVALFDPSAARPIGSFPDLISASQR